MLNIPMALYVGPALVLAKVNATWERLYVGTPPIGVPAIEAFTGEAWETVIRVMQRTLETGEMGRAPCTHDPDGLYVIRLPDEPGLPPAVVTFCSLASLSPIRPHQPRLPGGERRLIRRARIGAPGARPASR